ncbi:MAG: molybdenum cofactor biosynthesis protein MoaE [Verrucomicrobiales bacterium]
MTRPRFACSISDRPVGEIEEEFEPSTLYGADLRFHGVVRDSEEGRDIQGIEYTHYAEMALREMDRIGEAMRTVVDHVARVHHRVGFVAVGEASIVIRVQTVHGAEGFELCREYLRRIKSTVPIWKRPVFCDEPEAEEK